MRQAQVTFAKNKIDGRASTRPEVPKPDVLLCHRKKQAFGELLSVKTVGEVTY